MESKRLNSAALAAGICTSYIHAHGKPPSIIAETTRRLLAAMHSPSTVETGPVPAVLVRQPGQDNALSVA